MTDRNIFNSLFWRISAIFLLLLVIIGVVYLFITVRSARLYYQEANQRLNATVADHIVNDVSPFVNGNVNEEVVKELFHDVMVINPSLEVYLLDNEGKILTFFAPEKKIKRSHIPLPPVREFIQAGGEKFIRGTDPRHPEQQKVFSAAPVMEDGEIAGYIYVILASEEFESATQFLMGSYILRVGTLFMVMSLLGAFLIGLIAIWFITRYLQTIIKSVREFQLGDLQARIPVKNEGELSELAHAFNDMADTIVANIDELKKTHRLRRDLIANISHDLRTPLALINGYVETLIIKEDTLSHEERRKHLNTVLTSTEKLRGMVGELFELSKLEARQKLPECEPFFINELVQDISQKYQILARGKDISVKPILSKDIPPVYADVSMMERVIQNLLDNALKFTPNGGTVTVELERKEDAIEVRVTDTGPGISTSDLPYIFDRYRHTKTEAGSLENLGTGLGLAIVKKILELHGITIRVESSKKRGTTFIFDVDIYEQEPELARR